MAARFGVADTQVRRDHLLSHLLGALAKVAGDDVLFFGGTALSRTHLPAGRLSEDVDLVSLAPRSQVAAVLDAVLPRSVLRTHGRLVWEPPLSATRDVEPATLVNADGLRLRLQLLSKEGIARWPVERRPLVQRYADAPAAALLVPTRAAFVAWKTVAWADRAAARDLYDLWGLAGLGAVDAEAAALYVRCGPTAVVPGEYLFRQSPPVATWNTELQGQTRVRVGPGEALQVVRRAWEVASGR